MINYAPLCQKQAEYIRVSMSSWLNVAEGGKRSGKNIMNLMAWAACLESHPDKLHLAAGVSISSAKLNIVDSNGFGLKYIFAGRCREGQYQDRDAVFVKTITGDKIILISGGGDKGAVPKIKGNTYGTAYITEVNECHSDFVKECFTRTLTSSDRKLFFDLNPKAPGHWFYKDVLDFYDQMTEKGMMQGYNYKHFTVADNLSISQEKLKDLLLTYDKKSLWYMRDILGLRTVADGLIYPKHGESFGANTNEPMLEYVVSMDYGTRNATAALLWGYDGAVWHAIKEYRHSGRDTRTPKTDDEYYIDITEWIGNYPVKKVIVDPSAASFITLIHRRGRYTAVQADNDVINGIRNTATAMSLGMILFSDELHETRKEFEGYMWDDKSTTDSPIKENDHLMDAVRYFVQTMKLVRGRRQSLI